MPAIIFICLMGISTLYILFSFFLVYKISKLDKENEELKSAVNFCEEIHMKSAYEIHKMARETIFGPEMKDDDDQAQA